MKNVNVIKIGNSVKISISGKLYQKNCASANEADELFLAGITAKENPSDENIKTILGLLNDNTRIAIMAGLEHNPDTGEIFMGGFNTPIPETLVDVIKEYHEKDYPMDAIRNFWSLLMLNPDTRIRTVLFDFINTHDFVLTDFGYMVTYKAVHNVISDVNTTFTKFISEKYLQIKKKWKKNPNKYVVYKNNDGEYNTTKLTTAENWVETENDVEVMGNLDELFETIFNGDDNSHDKPTFTDIYTKKMKIELGVPVKQDRKECDADFRRDCSNGLHVGATKYVENFAYNNSTVLVCYVNPANVVAVPDYDHSKMRVSEYFPFAIANYSNGKIDVIEEPFFESDYTDYEVDELHKQLELIRGDELPIEKAMNVENDEERPMSELMKIIESRLVTIE